MVPTTKSASCGKQKAWTLSEIAEHGVEAFYSGSVANKIVADMEAHNGLITMQDRDEIVERASTTFRTKSQPCLHLVLSHPN